MLISDTFGMFGCFGLAESVGSGVGLGDGDGLCNSKALEVATSFNLTNSATWRAMLDSSTAISKSISRVEEVLALAALRTSSVSSLVWTDSAFYNVSKWKQKTDLSGLEFFEFLQEIGTKGEYVRPCGSHQGLNFEQSFRA